MPDVKPANRLPVPSWTCRESSRRWIFNSGLNSPSVRFVTAYNELPPPPPGSNHSRRVRCGSVVQTMQTFKTIKNGDELVLHGKPNFQLYLISLNSALNQLAKKSCLLNLSIVSEQGKMEFAKLHRCNAQALQCLRCWRNRKRHRSLVAMWHKMAMCHSMSQPTLLAVLYSIHDINWYHCSGGDGMGLWPPSIPEGAGGIA